MEEGFVFYGDNAVIESLQCRRCRRRKFRGELCVASPAHDYAPPPFRQHTSALMALFFHIQHCFIFFMFIHLSFFNLFMIGVFYETFIISRVFLVVVLFLDAPSHLYKRSCPSVRRSRVILRPVLGASCAVYPALFSFFAL